MPYALYTKTAETTLDTVNFVTITGHHTIIGKKTFTDKISVSNNIITNVTNPVNAQDAATKLYVDALEEKILQLQAEMGVKDIDGNSYKGVKIGKQVWMSENLKTTKYNDGSNIALVTDIIAWSNMSTPGYCWYNNNRSTYGDTYGALYNWYAINTGWLCPAGWHEPSDAEWTVLVSFLGGEELAGGKMKETGISHWNSPNTGATNESCFSDLPAGNRFHNGYFGNIGMYGAGSFSTEFSTTHITVRTMSYTDSKFYIGYTSKTAGEGVRCVRDN